MDTRLIRTPRYYGQFRRSRRKPHTFIGVRAIFYQGGGGGGGGEAFAQKILASCPNFYEKVEKKRGSYTML